MTKSALQTEIQDRATEASGPGKSKPAVEKPRSGTVLELPGPDPGTWEHWCSHEGREPFRLDPGAAINQKFRKILALPSASVFCWPLWISPEGDPLELARLELSGRHLLKRGMEEALKAIPLDTSADRRLVLALAPEEPFPDESLPEGWKEADVYVLVARLKAPSEGCDLLFWKEHGTVRGAFFREENPVWCFPADRSDVAGLLRRSTLRLLSEGILKAPPLRISLSGLGSKEADALRSALKALYPRAVISKTHDEAPGRPTDGSLPPEDILPAQARKAREKAKTSERLLTIGMFTAILYLLLILWGMGDLMIRQSALSKLRGELAMLEAPASKARKVSERWNALRAAIDPSTFPLDQLAAIAAPTAGGKVRLISVSMENGHLQISGEATDVTQAYSFMESLKKFSILQQYDWTSGQPQLAGKNSVKFEMEGARAHANP